jgi:hypothetical protein
MLERELSAAPTTRRPAANDPGAQQRRPAHEASKASNPPAPHDQLTIRTGDRRRAERRRDRPEPTAISERELIRVLLHLPHHLERVVEAAGAEVFRDPDLRAIFRALIEHGPDAEIETLTSGLDPDAIDRLQELLEERGGLENADATVDGFIARVRGQEMRAESDEVHGLLRIANETEQDQLLKEMERIAKEKRALGVRDWAAVRRKPGGGK